MTVRHVAAVGQAVLRRWAVTVEPSSLGQPAVQILIDDLVETMRCCNGAGLAAPPVPDAQRIAAMELNADPRHVARFGS